MIQQNGVLQETGQRAQRMETILTDPDPLPALPPAAVFTATSPLMELELVPLITAIDPPVDVLLAPPAMDTLPP